MGGTGLTARDATRRGANVRSGTSRSRRTLAAAVVAACAAVLASLVTAPSASAAPPDPVTASMEQIGDATYAMLFHTGLQIYEVAAVRPVENLYPPGNEMVLRRLYSADEGIPGAPRFAFVGTALPEAFVVAHAWQQPGVPSGLLMPADPVTLEEQPAYDNLRMVGYTSGPVGPFAGVGLSMPYLG